MLIKDFFHWKNIKKSPLTTVLGVILIGVATDATIKQKDIGAEEITLYTLGLGLIGAKDPKNENTASIFLAAVCSSVLLSSCVTLNRCKEKFGTQSTPITLRDTITVRDTVFIEPDSLQGSVSIDSLLYGKIDSLVHININSELSLKLWIDKYNRILNYRVDKKPKQIIIEKEVPVEVQGQCPDVVVADPNQALNWRDRLWKQFQFFSAWLVLGSGFIILVYVSFKRVLK
jgi:hypothetical protein